MRPRFFYATIDESIAYSAAFTRKGPRSWQLQPLGNAEGLHKDPLKGDKKDRGITRATEQLKKLFNMKATTLGLPPGLS